VTPTIDRARRHTLLAEAIATLEPSGCAATDAACASLLVADPEDLDALLLRGLTLAALGHVAPAARLLNGVAEARFAYAQPCRDLDRMLGAAEFATQVRARLDLTPDDARLRPMWADSLQLGDDLAGAVDVLAALLGDEPDNAAVQHHLGMVSAELGDFDTAIAHMVRAVALDPEPALGWADLACC
jgi:tetratricopeptide (TPR) repeat protein